MGCRRDHPPGFEIIAVRDGARQGMLDEPDALDRDPIGHRVPEGAQ